MKHNTNFADFFEAATGSGRLVPTPSDLAPRLPGWMASACQEGEPMSATTLPFSTIEQAQTPAERLRTSSAAVRLSFTWMGMRKVVSGEPRAEMAAAVEADSKLVGASKSLFDKGSEQIKALNRLRGQIRKYWQATTLPYTEPGIRLIRQSDLEAFDAKLKEFHAELKQAERDFETHYEALREDAKLRLGQLYNESDYPASILGLFNVEWDFPSVEPPDYLMAVRPDLYERERQRVAARFERAVDLAEAEFTSRLGELVDTLADKLKPSEDGKKKIFRQEGIDNFRDFFVKFRNLNVGSSTELDKLVGRAEQLFTGDWDKEDLKANSDLQTKLAAGLAEIRSNLDQIIVAKPRRSIILPEAHDAS